MNSLKKEQSRFRDWLSYIHWCQIAHLNVNQVPPCTIRNRQPQIPFLLSRSLRKFFVFFFTRGQYYNKSCSILLRFYFIKSFYSTSLQSSYRNKRGYGDKNLSIWDTKWIRLWKKTATWTLFLNICLCTDNEQEFIYADKRLVIVKAFFFVLRAAKPSGTTKLYSKQLRSFTLTESSVACDRTLHRRQSGRFFKQILRFKHICKETTDDVWLAGTLQPDAGSSIAGEKVSSRCN